MHGGAVGCAVEHACILSRTRNLNAQGTADGTQGVYELDCFVSGVDVRYISAMTGNLIITTADDPHSPQLGLEKGEGEAVAKQAWRSKSVGRIFNEKDGSLCAEYVCTWELH
jgi:hypothetical protein